MTPPTLLILAAGMGSRYDGGLKIDDPVGPDGETIMDYSIYDARRAGFGKIVFVIRRAMEERFREVVGTRFVSRFPIKYVYQDLTNIPPGFRVPRGRTKPWGTTHAILSAASAIHEPFAVINVDDFYGSESYRALAQHLQSGTADYAMVGYVLRNTLFDFGTVARGICQVSQNGFLENILELKNIERDGGHARNTGEDGQQTRLTGDEVVSMNMWGFTPQVFDQLHEHFERFLRENGADMKTECYIPNTVNELLRAGQARVRVLRCCESWFGVTYREDHTRAVQSMRRLIESGYYPRKLW
ncbi:MAG: NTP transferase domain-containing protein [Acidobacteriota bacterium]|nr:NTP transferase domain-containing protein [Acidobacteriota bacterium]